MTEIKIGDNIAALGYCFKVAKILYQEYYNRDGFDCEFIDDKGNYHHWKQWEDGGKVIPAIPTEKKYIDWYGTDVTDLLRKYGYC